MEVIEKSVISFKFSLNKTRRSQMIYVYWFTKEPKGKLKTIKHTQF